MDRLIALLAALVGLIALGGALLVHNSATAVMERQASEIAQLMASLTLINPTAPMPSFAALRESSPEKFTALVEYLSELKGD